MQEGKHGQEKAEDKNGGVGTNKEWDKVRARLRTKPCLSDFCLQNILLIILITVYYFYQGTEG